MESYQFAEFRCGPLPVCGVLVLIADFYVIMYLGNFMFWINTYCYNKFVLRSKVPKNPKFVQNGFWSKIENTRTIKILKSMDQNV